MIHFIKKIKSDYSIFRNILKLTDKKIPVIFYSEGRFYQKFSYSLVDLLAKKYPNQVYYVSSDVNDRLMDLHKKKKEFEKKDVLQVSAPEGTTNNLFVGSTVDLQRMLQDMNNPVKDDNVIDITDRLDDGKE